MAWDGRVPYYMGVRLIFNHRPRSGCVVVSHFKLLLTRSLRIGTEAQGEAPEEEQRTEARGEAPERERRSDEAAGAVVQQATVPSASASEMRDEVRGAVA